MTNRHARPRTVRDLVKSLSRTYRNACPGLTVITVRDFAKPANDQLFVRNAANTTWEGLFSGTAAEVRTALGLVIGSNVQPFDANIMKTNTAAVLSAAVTATPEDAGTKASGSYTPSPVGGNFKKYINGGAHTLAAPTFAGNYTLVIQVTNSASAGAITFSGFAKVIGDVLTTTNGQLFQIGLTKTDGGVVATVVAMQ